MRQEIFRIQYLPPYCLLCKPENHIREFSGRFKVTDRVKNSRKNLLFSVLLDEQDDSDKSENHGNRKGK